MEPFHFLIKSSGFSIVLSLILLDSDTYTLQPTSTHVNSDDIYLVYNTANIITLLCMSSIDGEDWSTNYVEMVSKGNKKMK